MVTVVCGAWSLDRLPAPLSRMHHARFKWFVQSHDSEGPSPDNENGDGRPIESALSDTAQKQPSQSTGTPCSEGEQVRT